MASPPPVPLTLAGTTAPVAESVKKTAWEVMVLLFMPPFGSFKTLVEIEAFSLTSVAPSFIYRMSPFSTGHLGNIEMWSFVETYDMFEKSNPSLIWNDDC